MKDDNWEKIEYSQLSEDWRYRDRLFFVIPAIIITVSGVFIGVAFGYITNLWIRVILLSIVVIWTFTMVVTLHKNIFFKKGTQELLEKLVNRNKILEGVSQGAKVFRICTPERKRSWIQKLIGYKLILYSSWLCFFAVKLLLVATVLQICFGWKIFP